MQRILGQMRKAIDDYNMIEENDKIGICLSGGKDSITMLIAFKLLQKFYPKKFDIIAISINPGFEFFDENLLKNICSKVGIPLIIERTQIKQIVFDIKKEKNPCSLCSNLRRGAINNVAIKEGLTKIALGHNQDDVLETFLLNLLFTANFSTFSPKTLMERSNITLIRPLIYIPEKDIKKYIKKNSISVMPKACPMDGNSKREFIKNRIFSLQKDIPYIRSNLLGVIKRNFDDWKFDNIKKEEN